MTSFSDEIKSFSDKDNFVEIVNFSGIFGFLCMRLRCINWCHKLSLEDRLHGLRTIYMMHLQQSAIGTIN